MKTLTDFSEIICADFEFRADPGERPHPLCLVAYGLKSGRRWRVWEDEFSKFPPYPVGPNVLFIAYFASAEIGCHLALNWPLPEYILDLCIEFKNMTNGLETLNGHSLLGALAYHGVDGIDSVEKDTMRELALRGGAYTAEERRALLNTARRMLQLWNGYCQS
jgi:DNA polymerase I